MSNPLDWQTSQTESIHPSGTNSRNITHSTVSNTSLTNGFESVINRCIDKATSLLSENITDDSRYFLFEWDKSKQALSIVVTDDSKTKDSIHIVSCQFTNPLSGANDEIFKSKAEAIPEYFSERLRECIHNYMTTCHDFMQYSLIAVYHDSDRNNTRLV